MARRVCIEFVEYGTSCLYCVVLCSPTAVYSRVVRGSLVVMNVVWFCTARVYIARYYISL